jgi:hypothetical protein
MFFLFVYNRTKRGAYELDMYLSRKHDELLANTLEHGSYEKKISLVIVDGFAVEITEDQVTIYATCILFNQYLSKTHLIFFLFNLLFKTGQCA